MIPKLLHLCWLSGDSYPEKIKKCIDSWKRILPDYEIKLWDINSFNFNSLLWTKQAIEKKQWAFVSDFIRFYALYNYGGIYLDSDVEVIKSFNDLLNQKYFFCYEYTALPEAAVVGAEKGLDWCKACLEWYENHSFLDAKGNMQRIIAPIVMKQGFEKCNNIKLIDTEQIENTNGGSIYPYDYFSAKNGFSGAVINTKNSYSIHHFNSAWLKQSQSVKFKRIVHILLIKFLGKKKYNKLLYKIRNNKSNIMNS